MTKPLYKCMTKATTAEGDQLQYGPNWLLSKRGFLKVFDDRLECGKWVIENDTIKEAVLYSIRSYFFIPGYVLKISTEERSYHFGLNAGSFWKNDLPFPVVREKGQLGYSRFSIVVRLVLIGSIGYLLWERFFK